MPAFKTPDLQERQEAAARAKSAALAQYRAKPPVDQALMAERAARRLARETAEAEKRATARREKEEAVAAKRQQEIEAAAVAFAAANAEAEAAARAKEEAAAQKPRRSRSGLKRTARLREMRATLRAKCVKGVDEPVTLCDAIAHNQRQQLHA